MAERQAETLTRYLGTCDMRIKSQGRTRSEGLTKMADAAMSAAEAALRKSSGSAGCSFVSWDVYASCRSATGYDLNSVGWAVPSLIRVSAPPAVRVHHGVPTGRRCRHYRRRTLRGADR